jgi:ATP-dependent RNA helicase DDX56/DBP9
MTKEAPVNRKARNVRRRVSFSVPNERPVPEVAATGVHAPLNVVVAEDSDDASVIETPESASGSDDEREDVDAELPDDDEDDDDAGVGADGDDDDDDDDGDDDDDDGDGGTMAKTPDAAERKTAAAAAAAAAASGSGSSSESASDSEGGSDSDSDDAARSGADGAESALQPPPPCATFGEMNLDKRVSWAVAKLGWRRPTPVQSAAVPSALAGRDVLVAAPTGSGKTAAYAIPLANQLCAAETARGHTLADGTMALVLVPTRELASQVSSQLRKLLKYVQGAHVATLTSSSAATKPTALLANARKRRRGEPAGGGAEDKPETTSFARTAAVLVGTPAAVVALRKQHGDAVLEKVSFVVVDEADLVLSFGHGADARSALAAVPPTAQAMLVSATLDADGLPELRKVVLRHPLTVKVTATPGRDPSAAPGDGMGPGASHYFARLRSPLDRYLVTYAMLRLHVISGKVLIFTNGINSAFRLKLFLDQFKVRSAVLNAELPANSRVHCVEQYNAGIFDVLIATDEVQRDDSSGAPKRRRKQRARRDDGEGEAEAAGGSDGGSGGGESDKGRGRRPPAARDAEFGVARGVDFRGVAAVINFDVPEADVCYTHRAGRTARAGASGTVLSLVVSAEEQTSVVAMGQASGVHVGPLAFRMDQIEAFRYRVEDSLRTVTNAAVRDARLAEVRREMINSDRLKDYFEDNPLDLDALKHDSALAKNVPEHLARVPGYLLPPSLRSTVSNNPITRSRNRRRGAPRGSSTRSDDPLKTFSTERRSSGSSRDRYKSRHGVAKKKGAGGGSKGSKRFGSGPRRHA